MSIRPSLAHSLYRLLSSIRAHRIVSGVMCDVAAFQLPIDRLSLLCASKRGRKNRQKEKRNGWDGDVNIVPKNNTTLLLCIILYCKLLLFIHPLATTVVSLTDNIYYESDMCPNNFPSVMTHVLIYRHNKTFYQERDQYCSF